MNKRPSNLISFQRARQASPTVFVGSCVVCQVLMTLKIRVLPSELDRLLTYYDSLYTV